MKKAAILKKLTTSFWTGIKYEHRRYLLCALAVGLLFCAQNAMAFTVPTSGSFAYDLYDLAVNQILKGPVGFVAGIGFMILCVFAIARQMVLPAILCLFAGVILIKADAIVVTLGGIIA